MTTKKNTPDTQNAAFIGIDLGDTKHAICTIDQLGKIIAEYSIPNNRKQIEKLAQQYPSALIAMEVGTHSPWISRLLQKHGNEVIVANARKLRAIYTNERKSDLLDARMIVKLARVDPELLYPIHHCSEDTQIDFLTIKMRKTLVDQRVNIVNAIRGSLKALPISKTGSRYLRKLLVQCAQYNLGHFGQDSDLRCYGENIYLTRNAQNTNGKKGSRAAKRKAVIAVARKLSVLMLTLWQRECDYDPLKNANRKQAA